MCADLNKIFLRLWGKAEILILVHHILYVENSKLKEFLALEHRVSMSPLIFASCRDCPSYLASAETVRNLLLPAETVVLGK